MNIGIYSGGFKPFTTGHFSKLALAMKENELVVLIYGLADREKGESKFNYTTEIAEKIFNITKHAIERTFSKVRVVKVSPGSKATPMKLTFQAIQQFAGTQLSDKEPVFFEWGHIGINPAPSAKNGDILTIYLGDDTLGKYSPFFNTQKYYGTAYQDGRLRFETGIRDESDEMIIDAVREYNEQTSDEELKTKSRVRGTQVRDTISTKNKQEIFRFLPPFYTDEEKKQVANILIGGLKENLLRKTIRSMILVG